MAAAPEAYALGRLELGLCFAVWIWHCATSVWIASEGSRSLDRWIGYQLRDSPYGLDWQYDRSDLEWSLHKPVIPKLLGVFLLHSAVFRLSHKFVVQWPVLTRLFLIVFWAAMTLVLASTQCLTIISIHAVVTIVIAAYYRKEVIVWISCITFIIFANRYAYFSAEQEKFYLEYTLYLYTGIQILNVGIHLSRNPNKPVDRNTLIQFCEYLLYPMYSGTLIVLFEDFQSQIETVRKRASSTGSPWPKNVSTSFFLIKAIRLLFWFCVIELFLHFIHANAVVHAHYTLIAGLSNYQTASIAFMAGKFFYLKYVFIFGVPSFFALLDGMEPPGPPVCISRITKYSQMWRYFDRGLYEFLKHQVYIPLMAGAKGFELMLRRLCGMVAVFSFVLAWHGTRSHYLIWVFLSAFEILMERIGRTISKTKQWQQFVKTIGPKNEIRIVAVALDMTIIPGLLGVFSFLSQEGTGEEIIRKLLIEGVKYNVDGDLRWGKPGAVLIHMLILGYFYNHCCLYLEKIMHPKLEKQKME